MYKFCVQSLFWIFMGTCTSIANSGAFDITFRRISPQGGFSYSAINCVLEDAKGFIWFSSQHGLFRYNSRNFDKFIHHPGDSSTIQSNWINSLALDPSGTIWVANTEGVCYYDELKEAFTPCVFTDSLGNKLTGNTTQVLCDSLDRIWLIVNRSVAIVNPENNRYYQVNIAPDLEISLGYVDENKRIWFGTYRGEIYYSDYPYTSFNLFNHARNAQILTMLFFNNRLWVGYEWQGADCFNSEGELIAHYHQNGKDSLKILNNRVRKVFADDDNNIWLGTYKGITVLTKKGNYHLNDQNTEGLAHSSIYDIYMDSKKGIWVSTWSGTLSYANPYDNHFLHLKNVETPNSLSNNVISSFAETENYILIGTEFGGLHRFDRENLEFSQLKIGNNSIKINNIKSLKVAKNGSIWVGTFREGIWFSTGKNNRFVQLDHPQLIRNSFYDIEILGDTLWAASIYNGLFRINTKTKEVKNYYNQSGNPNSLSNNTTRALLIDHEGTLWIGTQDGLSVMKKGDEYFTRFMQDLNNPGQLSSNQIFTLFEDHDDNIWVGTSMGLNVYLRDEDRFVHYTPDDGIAGYEIYGILEDSSGKLYVSTENGISVFDPATSEVQNFYLSDGLQGNQFNPNVAFLASNGEMYFGGPNGVTLFDPSKLRKNPVPPTVILSGVLVNNEILKVNEENGPLRQSVSTVKELQLKNFQNSLTFQFVADNYLMPEKNKFRYRLVNYDDKWIDAGTQGIATYTKIPAGNYIFQVKAANNDGVWNEQPYELLISIEQILWKRWYAYLLYVIVLSLIIYSVRKEILLKRKLHNDFLLEKMKRESEENLHQEKLRFFTNISHEIRTPLSLILSPLSQVLQKKQDDPEMNEYLDIINRNGIRLKHLTQQVTDIRKMEIGKLKVNPKKIDFVQLVKEGCDCFVIEARDKHISFNFMCEYEKLEVFADDEKLDKVVFNLLSNAFKHTPVGGTINVHLKIADNSNHTFLLGETIEGNYIELLVEDNGEGIDTSELRLIFDRFYQGKENTGSGTGIGLHMVLEYTKLHHGNIHVESGKGSGALFTVRIPLSKEKFIVRGKPDAVLNVRENAEFEKIVNEKEDGVNNERKQVVLVVEDNVELRSYLRQLLQHKYKVITASNGIDGKEMAMDLNPDLIIADVMMPGLSGFELCNQLKQDLNTSHIPIMLLTSLAGDDQQIEGLETGADDYIVKPFNEKLLLVRIENLLISRKKLREAFIDPEGDWPEKMSNMAGELGLIEKAIRVIESHLLDTSFSVEVLSQELGLSRSSLHRKLRAHTDQSATEFIRYVRLKKAVKMLKEGEKNIDEIAYNVGFNSPSYFSQSFKKQFGKSPKEYIQKKSN